MNEGVGTIEANSERNGQPLAPKEKIVNHLDEISKNSRTTFYALILACIYSYLAIGTTSDAALLTNSGATPLPIIQVRVPIVWFYYFAPVLLMALFLYFHFYLERFWYAISRMPLMHPEDGRWLDDYLYPWLISTTVIRGIHPKLGRDRRQLFIEYALVLVLAWWFIPIIIFFYWARYLVAHEWKGTLLHSLLLIAAIGFAFRFYYLAKNAVMAVPENTAAGTYHPRQSKTRIRYTDKQVSFASAITLLFAGFIFYLSLSAFHGIQTNYQKPIIVADSYAMFTPGTTFLGWFRIQTYADIKEKRLVTKPFDWQDLLSDKDALKNYLDAQERLKLKRMNLRHIDARDAFLPASDLNRITLDYALLQNAVLTLSRLENVSFRGANLTHADFRYAVMSGARFENVVADVARFNHTRFIPNAETGSTTFSGEYNDAVFEHSVGDSLHFKHADLLRTNFTNAKINYSLFDDVDFAGAKLDYSELMKGIFIDTDFSDAQMQAADLSASEFENCTFESTALNEANFEDAKIRGSKFDNSQRVSDSLLPFESESDLITKPNLINMFYGSGIQLENVIIHNMHFINEADFRFAIFKNVDFKNVKFEEADFSGATFINTDFSGIVFVKADFSGADLTNTIGLAEHHLTKMCGNEDTKLPVGIDPLIPCIQPN